MKISIITIHNIHNFGSVFQAYALCKYLNNKGHQTEIVDYNPVYFRKKKIKTILGQLLNIKQYKTRKSKFESFVKKNIKLSSREYLTLEDLTKNPPVADIYISGGDQLWNSYHDCGRDPSYKLKFTDGYKISYATSMGRDNYTNEELLKLKDDLHEYQCISVRESSSVKLLNSVEVNNVTQVVDPVLLFNTNDYNQFLTKPKIDKYLFVYLVQPSELLEETVDFISRSLGLKVVLYGGMAKKCKCDYFLKDLGPDEVLSYLRYADFVISASFHATLFSIMYHKQFVTLLPDKHTNDRIEDLLKWSKMTDRLIKNNTDLEKNIFGEIDFVETDFEINKRINLSKDWLEKAINNFDIKRM